MGFFPFRRGLRRACGLAVAILATLAPVGAPAQTTDLAVGPPPGARGDEVKFRFLFDPVASWPSTVFWHYNPAGAPTPFSDPAVVATAMQQAIDRWKASCNVGALYAGQTGVPPENATIDQENGTLPDQINVMGWRPTPAGIAGYTVAFPGSTPGGVIPIIDADVVVDPAKVSAIDQLTRLLAHEFGHVLGISHSQFDAALMSGPPYSNYNALDLPAVDDVRACRCLYGAPPGVSTGLLCTMPALIDFGNAEVGAQMHRSIEIANNGNAALAIASVTTSPPAAYQASGCAPGTTLLPGVKCTMQVTFAPTTAGDLGGSISIGVGEPAPYRIRLLGSASGGTASPFTPTPGALEFGDVPIATASSTQRVRFRNGGAAAVTIAQMLFEGPNANEFTRSGQCKSGQTVAAGDMCSVDIAVSPSATGPRSAQFVVVAGDGRRTSIPVAGTGTAAVNTPEPSFVLPVTVVEFYRSVSDHYFVTIAADEIAALDTGLFPGWTRTGLTFKAHATSQPGYSPICRFYLPPPADSHFYSASPQECTQVAAQNPSFILESTAVMHLAVPNPLSGACASGTVPIYRTWNRRSDTNHRYTASLAVRDQMVAMGHVAEGSGPDAVTFCAPQ